VWLPVPDQTIRRSAPVTQTRRLAGLVLAMVAPLPAVVTAISLTFCAMPPVVVDLELAVLPLLGFPLAAWFAVSVVLGSPLHFFTDPVKLVAGAVKGRIPHMIATFVLAQAVLFWLVYFAIVNADPGGCGLSVV
jgi:hypothetical protein